MKSIIKNIILIAALSTPVFADQYAQYELSITNLTKGQPLTPAAIIIHDRSYRLFEVGEASGQGLYKLAEDGITDNLQQEVESGGARFLKLDGLTLPGETSTITFEASPYEKVSIASMLARTNDAFASTVHPVSLYIKPGYGKSRLLRTFDAGSESNNERQEYIPAFGNSQVRTDESEGFVTFHPGLQGVGDLDLEAFSFASESAKIKIRRIK